MDTKHLISSYIEGKLIILKILSTPSPQFNVDIAFGSLSVENDDCLGRVSFVGLASPFNIDLGERGGRQVCGWPYRVTWSQPNKDNYKAPNLVSVLENEKILKIGHFLRFDKNALEFFLKCKMKNIFDTKIASKIVRTYTDSHGLKNLVQEFCNKSLDKRQGSSDWNKDINELSEKQLEYAANDVIYLHKIKVELEKMLIREKRIDIFNKCLAFLDTRVVLDQTGFKFDIFEH